MQFIPYGPDIPNELLNAHEDGKVVFFCGAGISMPLGLPNFEGLVKKIYKLNHVSETKIEKQLGKKGFLDRQLELLEGRIDPEKNSIRKSLLEILQPTYKRNAMETHLALLKLSKTRNEKFHIVTTNFDRIFLNAAKKHKIGIPEFIAPYIPIPKSETWNGIVYLHGQIPEEENDIDKLNNLVLTSSDFGRAYLTERWASRFVSELFRKFVVCFVGYSINDPILKYMLDALAADRKQGESTLPVYAFTEESENSEENTWPNNSITHIKYKNTGAHKFLHKTLKGWADSYSNYIDGKIKYVREYAHVKPSPSIKDDNYVGRMIWALSDPSGKPAEELANITPPAPIEWIYAISGEKMFLSTSKFQHKLSNSTFTLLNRPRLDSELGWAGLFSKDNINSWDKPMLSIATWLTKYLNNPKLILWAAEKKCTLDKVFSTIIQSQIEHLKNMPEQEKKKLSIDFPEAIPDKRNTKIWELIINGYTDRSNDFDLYNWVARYQKEPIDIIGHKNFMNYVSPKIEINRHLSFPDNDNEKTEDKNFLDIEVVLNNPQLRDVRKNIQKIIKNKIPLNDIQKALEDFLCLSKTLDLVSEKFDKSEWNLPSIEDHSQNKKYFNTWGVLIEILRDIWLDIEKSDSPKALGIAKSWFNIKYPVFKRLAFFAAAKNKRMRPKIWLKWLLSENAYWLWNPTVYREVLRLLNEKGNTLSSSELLKLEEVIKLGPPPQNYSKEIYSNIKEYEIWHYLLKLQKGGCKLSKESMNIIADGNPKYSHRIYKDERDEFNMWSTSSSDAEYINRPLTNETPYKIKNLVDWLAKDPHDDFEYRDNWKDFCVKNYKRAAYGLYFAVRKNKCSSRRIDEALQTWAGNKDISTKLLDCFGKSIIYTPVEFLQNSKYAIAWWIDQMSHFIQKNTKDFISICLKIIDLKNDNKEIIEDKYVVTSAINDPIGHVTNALFIQWLKTSPQSETKLSQKWKNIFKKLSNPKYNKLFYAKFFLGEYLIPLYRVDKEWTKKHVLPLFDWKNSRYTNILWYGFFFKNRIDIEILKELKLSFLDIANNFDKIKDKRESCIESYISMSMYMALNKMPGYKQSDFMHIFEKLPAKNLFYIWKLIRETIKDRTDKKAFWGKTVKPFYQNIFTKDLMKKNQKLSHEIALFIIESNEIFIDVFNALKRWLIPIDFSYDIIKKISSSSLTKDYPKEILEFLHSTINEKVFLKEDLKECLKKITETYPNLAKSKKYNDLRSIT